MSTLPSRIVIALLVTALLILPTTAWAAPPAPSAPAAPAAPAAPPAPSAPAPGGAVHVVQWGETLALIASRYGVTTQAISAANGLTNPNLIYVGQRLIIPTSGVAPNPGGGTHVVAPGETLTSIAYQYGTTVGQLAALNNLTNANFIYVGQILTLPGGGWTPSPSTGPGGCASYYIVRSGDTLSGIAWRYGTTISALMQANNLYSDFIWSGQQLCIPVGGMASAPQQSPSVAQPPKPTPVATYAAPAYPTAAAVPVYPTAQPVYPTPPPVYPTAVPVYPTPQPPTYAAPTPAPQAAPITQSGQPGGSYQYYVVKDRDTLASIALRFGVTQTAIMQANNISHASLIYTGQQLVIPAPAPVSVAGEKYEIAFARWYPDQYGITGKYDIFTAYTDGSGETLRFLKAASPSWSPDKQYMLILGEEGVDRQEGRLDTWAVWEGITDGILVAQISPWPEDFMQMNIFQIEREATARATAWARDGSWIAWDANLQGKEYHTFTRGRGYDMTDWQPGVDIPGEQPDWAPTGSQITYRSGRNDQQGIWISNADDSAPHRITEDGSDSFPRWSPNGNLIAFHREVDGNVDVYTMAPDGSNLNRITTDPGHDTLPAWTPDGRIVFRSDRNGTWGIYIMSAAGGGQTLIIPDADPGPDWAFGRMDVR
jgi:LysM repeat protein